MENHENHENLNQDSQCPGKVSNLSPPKYKTEELLLEHICSV
jgi:hypothetical protein